MSNEFMELYNDELHDVESFSSLSCYQLFYSDVGLFECFDDSKNFELLGKINTIIQELDIIFDYFKCDNSIIVGKRVPWIADKVQYCLECCEDEELSKQLTKLFDKFCYYRDRIVEGNLRLVILIAGNYDHRKINICFEDIIQYGNIGLMRAIEKYDISNGTKFSSYASKWINQIIKRQIIGVDHSLRVPINLIYKNISRLNTMDELSMELGRSVSDKEFAINFDDDNDKLAKMAMAFMFPVPLDETIEAKYGDVELTRKDLVADESVNVFKSAINSEYRKYLEHILSCYLTNRELEVLKLSVGLDGIDYSLIEIASILGITQQRVSQLNKSAIKKLRKIPNIREIVID